ncbi:D-alanyl-D-alanine carboxypeptidase family protein [Microbacterium sp. P04]|uniref:D-alanyl-D-alanine carboxypeptidase family protein n=1 Tax=Microbacterium sp. P04 TaxID=3366947 RepID=UPI00374691C7
MGSEATAPPSRRELRERATASQPIIVPPNAEETATSAEESATSAEETATGARPASTPQPTTTAAVATQAPARSAPVALVWIDGATLTSPDAPAALTVAGERPDAGADLLATAPRRRILRPGVVLPVLMIFFVVAVYVATTLLWPLYAVAPQVEAVAVQSVAAPAAAPAWPAEGSAALSVSGVGGVVTSSEESIPIASITKLVTALMVLDRMPLAVGEAGPDFAFTAADRARYRQDLAAGESALDVPVGGSLSQYQMLEGLLIGSANNYADRLAGQFYPSDAVFADAARSWLQTHGLEGITIADPSGILPGNAATAEALIPLAEKALANPVIAEIVAKPTVDLPGAGRVENTNPLLGEPGVVGLKTGTLDSYNLLAAKDVTVDGTTVRLFGSVLGQPDRDTRAAAMRALFAEAEQELQPHPSVAAGTLVGQVITLWAEPIDITTTADADVVLWNNGVAEASTDFSLGDADLAGSTVGSLTVTGPVDAVTIDAQLTGDIEPPDAWWRLTHPLELFGLAS